MALMLQINDLIEGTVYKRPSAYIKTPYVADIVPLGEDKTILGHTAALGCCGLADVGATILMAPVKNTKNDDKLHCEYRVYLSVIKERGQETVVGIHPKLAEELVESALKKNLLSSLQNVLTYRRETAIYVAGKVDSRFDFTGIDCNDVPFIMEVKNVPLADYEDITAKDRKKRAALYDAREIGSKVAYFPDGYRKKVEDTVSPRALKHIKELTLIKKESKTRCIMCYVIQRTDVESFQPSIIDPEYRTAFYSAMDSGVEIITLVVNWTREGNAYFVKDNLKINL